MKRGYVALVGAPNVGKSTILNGIIGKNIASVTAKPQTTTMNLSGIYTKDDVQIVFLDTPGLHETTRAFNKTMNQEATQALRPADVVVFIVDGSRPFLKDNEFIINRIPLDKPLITVINKIDLISPIEAKNIKEQCKETFPNSKLIETSAIRGFNLNEIVEEIIPHLSEGMSLYEENIFTTATKEFLISETIRAKAMMLTKQEIPHSIAVVVDELIENEEKMIAYCRIICERKSQRGILIGSGGKMIKRIRLQSEYELKNMFGKPCELDLFVAVIENWRDDPKKIKRIQKQRRG